jgi:DNA polymerase-3 subunit epsilon
MATLPKNPIVRDIEALHLFTTNLNSLDATQRLKLNKDGVVVFNFGKYVDQSVIDIFKKEKGYYNWMMSKDFSQQVKNIITNISGRNYWKIIIWHHSVSSSHVFFAGC